jgi:hypothetical protein
MAVVAQEKPKAGTGEKAFYQAKVHTARFYFERLLPRTLMHKESMLSGSDNLMEMEAALFAF